MKTLKALFEGVGLRDVTTYVQSGNVVFTAATAPEAADLEAAIAGEFGIDVTVILRTAGELAAVLGANPFLGGGAERSKLHVTFLAGAPAPGALDSLDAARYPPDEFRLLGREVYLHTPGGYGRSKLGNDFFERKTGLRATTRNWNTVTRLVELSA